ncbi:MAG TPA: ribulose-phosphate 3-epimerase, partial [Candidatus Edwardsbacteria bacterium]|nr:ribulose-phosphate 3-epimerase [Candidatus Edwardsbacteria bacterium]
MGKIVIAPSLLSADFAKLEEEIRSVERAGADWLHLDVMDGQFVPNLTFGPLIVAAIDRLTRLPLDVHLMIRDPLQLAERFVQAGADWLTVHGEAVGDGEAALRQIKTLGAKAGISLNPGTPLAAIARALPAADLVLVMSVNPGFGGQRFIREMLAKVRALRAMADAKNPALDIEVDG